MKKWLNDVCNLMFIIRLVMLAISVLFLWLGGYIFLYFFNGSSQTHSFAVVAIFSMFYCLLGLEIKTSYGECMMSDTNFAYFLSRIVTWLLLFLFAVFGVLYSSTNIIWIPLAIVIFINAVIEIYVFDFDYLPKT